MMVTIPVPLHLPAGVHAVQVRDDLVFLDTKADAYFCLGGGADVVTLATGGDVHVGEEEAAAELLEAGLLTLDDCGPAAELPCRPLRSAFGQSRREPCSPAALAAAIGVTWRVARRLARCSFAELLEPTSVRASLHAEPSAPLLEAVAQFEEVRPWLPLEGECLARCYQLRAFLRARGFDALWVFGVRTWPFTAHCWLQVGGTVLDEDLERLTAYAPIMAV